MKKRENKQEPTIAVGMDTEAELKEDATYEEVANSDYTEVTSLLYGDNDPNE